MSSEETQTPIDDDDVNGEKGLSSYVYYIAALALMALALGGWAWLNSKTPRPAVVGVASATPRPLPAGDEDAPGDAFGLVPGLATPWAVAGGPGETPTVVPEVTPVHIPLLGPPAGSIFRMEDTISFYWSAAGEPSPNQRYGVYLLDGGERVLLGSAVGPNLGQGYQIRATIGEFVDEPGEYRWLVVLEDVDSGAIIGQSEIRPITLMLSN